jgi:hypothetical protein
LGGIHLPPISLIDVSEDASNSTGVQTDGLLLSGIVFPATMTGANVTFDFSFDGSTWVDVVETDNTAVTYAVSAGNVVRVDPSGWAFAAAGFKQQIETYNLYLNKVRSHCE